VPAQLVLVVRDLTETAKILPISESVSSGVLPNLSSFVVVPSQSMMTTCNEIHLTG
jgi:hypothetical protein